MDAESIVLIGVLLVEVIGGAICGVIALRSGRRSLRHALRLRHLPLLEGVDIGALRGTTEPIWPIGGRWPTPQQHRSHLDDDDLRGAYARLARAKARTRVLAAEVIVVIATALLGFTLPTDISSVLHLQLSPVSSEGYGSFIPRDAPLQTAKALWRSFLLVSLICGALAIRADASWLVELADKYERYGQGEEPAATPELSNTWLAHLKRWWRRAER